MKPLLLCLLLFITRTDGFGTLRPFYGVSSVSAPLTKALKINSNSKRKRADAPFMPSSLHSVPSTQETDESESLKASLPLTLAYCSVMMSTFSLPAILPLLKADVSLNCLNFPAQSAFLLSCQQLTIMLGKLTLGGPTDKIGGKTMLQLVLTVMGVCMIGVSVAPSFKILGCFWLPLIYAFSAGWGAVGKEIRESFSNTKAKHLSAVASAARLGVTSASFLIGTLVRGGFNWRQIMRLIGSSQLMFAFQWIFRTRTSSPSSSSSSASHVAVNMNTTTITALENVTPEKEKETTVQLFKRVIVSKEFWLMLISKMTLLSLGQFGVFTTLFLGSKTSLSVAGATFWAGMFPLGALTASLTSTALYQKLDREKQRNIILGLNIAGAILTSLLFGHSANILSLSNPALISVLFMLGLAWCVPYYIPLAVGILELGGTTHAATLT